MVSEVLVGAGLVCGGNNTLRAQSARAQAGSGLSRHSHGSVALPFAGLHPVSMFMATDRVARRGGLRSRRTVLETVCHAFSGCAGWLPSANPSFDARAGGSGRMQDIRRPLATLAALMVSVAASLPAVGQSPPAVAASSPPAAPGIPVQVATAARKDVPVLLRNIGAVQANQTVLVRARVDGTLEKILFREGQDVKAGDALALIDPRPYQAALDQVQSKRAADLAQLANAQRDLARYANLAKSDFASRQQLDTQTSVVAQLQATVAGDEAAIATARLNVEFCHIVSPIDGRTGLRLVDAGNLVHASDATGIVSITQIHPIAVTFTLPQDSLPRIQAAMAAGTLPVQAYTADNATQLSAGNLLTTDNSIDQTTGTIRLKAEFANADDRLWPGQFINVRLQVETLRHVVTVPSISVQRGPNGLFVYVVKPDSTAAMQPVEVSQDDGKVAVIAKGVDEGAQVVANGMSRLQNGSRVAAEQSAAAGKTGS